MSKIEEKVENLLANKIVDLGYELYDVEYQKEGKEYYLRIYIENSNGISLDDCEKVSIAITDILDEADYIKEQYFLEVSSTGVEKVLRKDKHLEKNLGIKVQIRLFKQINNEKELVGILKKFNNNEIQICINENEVTLQRENIAQIKTIYDWN